MFSFTLFAKKWFPCAYIFIKESEPQNDKKYEEYDLDFTLI